MAFPQANTGGSSYGQRPPAPVVNHFVGADGNAYVQTGDSTTGGMTVAGIGTPGTGEPAHAGGGTGLIGWARDILAKIAAFGTSAVPSADVLSVQEGQLVTSSVLSTSGQSHVALCSGMSEVVFRIYDNAGGPGIAPSSTDATIEGWHSAHGSEGTNANWVPLRVIQDSGLAYTYTRFTESSFGYVNPAVWHPNQYVASCFGFEKVRFRLSGATPASAYRVIAAVHPSASRVPRLTNANIVCDAFTTSSSQTQPLYTANNSAVYYTDTATPLGAGATFTGSSRTMAQGNNFFNLQVFANQSSAANAARVRKSTDGTNFVHCREGQLSANVPVEVIAKRTAGTYRVEYVNGGVSQTEFNLSSSQTPN